MYVFELLKKKAYTTTLCYTMDKGYADMQESIRTIGLCSKITYNKYSDSSYFHWILENTDGTKEQYYPNPFAFQALTTVFLRVTPGKYTSSDGTVLTIRDY